MARKTKTRKVKTEAEIAKDRADLEERKAKVLEMRARGLVVVCDAQWRVVSARRLDVFQTLFEQRPHPAITQAQLDAVRRLEGDVSLASGAGSAPDNAGVRSSTEGAPGQNISQAMVDASKRVERVYHQLGPVNKVLIIALMNLKDLPHLNHDWREVVEALTGETNDRAQIGAVRLMLTNLAAIYGTGNERAEVQSATTYLGQMNSRVAA